MQVSSPGTPRRRGSRSRLLALGAALASLTLLVAACGSGGTSGSSSPPVGKRVTVQLTEYRIGLPHKIFSPGTYTFVAVNAGRIGHALEIDGPGVVEQHTRGILQPGQSATLTVTLHPGTFDMYCPVDGHRMMGMQTQLTVTGSTPGGGTGGY
ncbi:MAG: hypothetical protein ACRDSP_17105 [Pseudonocardiaceae bacterium]